MDDEQPMIAGLRLTWRTFPGPDHGEASSGGNRGSHDALGDNDEAAFGLWVLADPDATLDTLTQEEFERDDERMPYFALVWPSAESLVAAILAGPRLDGQHVLDLGCGLGACGFAAARQGARVTFFDWEPRALEIVAATASRQQLPADAFTCLVGDWRRPPPFGPFDLILGADVLYEQRNAPAVAAFLARHLKPGAEAWIADPGRIHAGAFPSLAEAEGLTVESQETLPPGAHVSTITLLRLKPAGAGSPAPDADH